MGLWSPAPLVKLQWDLGEWEWHDVFVPPDHQYIVQLGRHILIALGRHILIAQRPADLAAAEHWQWTEAHGKIL